MNESQSPKSSPRGVLVGVLLLAVVVIVGGVYFISRGGSGGSGNADAGTTPITVAQWGQERYLIYLPLYVAMEEGYFEQEGLDVDLIFTGNDDQTFAAVLGGSAQFGIGDPAFAAIANQRGAKAQVIALVVGGVAIWGVTNNDSVGEIEKPGDLAGLRVGTFPSPSTNYTLMRALINDHSDELSGTSVVEADIGSQLALLESNSADIAMVLEPAASVAESEGYRVVYSSPKFHGPFAFTGVTTTTAFVNQNKEQADGFVRGLQRAVRASHDDPSIAIRVGRSLFPDLPEQVVQDAVGRMLEENTFPDDVTVNAEAWGALMQVRQTVGDIRNPADVEDTVNNSFAEAARGP